VTRLIKY